MTLLLRDTKTDEAPPEVSARACDQCGAEMAADQDWCLACGTAAPGRLGSRHGLRAAATAVALTLVLAGSAVAASYAALSEDATREAAAPPPPDAQPIAQAPPPIAAPPAAPATTPPETPAPTVDPPATGGSSDSPASDTGDTIAPTDDPVDDTTDTGTDTTDDTTDDTGTDDETDDTTDEETEEEADPEPVELELPADAADVYDPYGRAIAKGDPADATDASLATAWKVQAKPEGAEMGVGFVVDLGKSRSVKFIELVSKTPGFRVEIYAATGSALPPDILDTRWAHKKDRSLIGAKNDVGKESIRMGAGSTKYRYYLLWFTTPPTDGRTVRISDFKLFG